MKAYSEYFLLLSLAGLLVGINQFFGARVLFVASVLSGLWFVITIVLLTRPPGIPEFVSDEVGKDEQHVIRKDVIPKLPFIDRLRIALTVACGSCLLVGLTLAILAR